MVKFRFQDLKIWQLAIEIADAGFDIADELEQRKLLNIARRSTFENANILILLGRRNLISASQQDVNLVNLDRLCRQITNFIKSLK